MSITPDFRKQIKINESVIELGEELKDIPAAFFYGLTPEQFELCKKVIAYVEPQSKTTIEEIYKIEKLTSDAKVFKICGIPPIDNMFIGIFTYFGEARKFYNQIHGKDAVFSRHLEEFKTLTQCLKAKVHNIAIDKLQNRSENEVEPRNQLDKELAKELPSELVKVILGMTDIKTMNAYKVLSKETQGHVLQEAFGGLYESDNVFLEFAGILGLQIQEPKDAKKEINRFIRTFGDLIIHDPTNTYTSTADYHLDTRFDPIFNKTINDLASKGLSRDDMRLIGRWNTRRYKIRFWEEVSLAAGEPVFPKDIRGQLQSLEECEQGIKETNDEHMKMLKEKLSQLLKFEIFLNSIPDDILLLSSLEEFTVRGGLSSFPDVLIKLNNLKKLNLGKGSFTRVPESIRQMEALEELRILAPVSFDFVADMPNLKKITFGGDVRDAFSPEVLEKLKLRKNFLVEPYDLKWDLYSTAESGDYRWHFKQKKLRAGPDARTIENVMKADGLTVQDTLFVMEFLKARDALIVLSRIAESWNQTAAEDEKLVIPDGNSFPTCEAVIKAAKELMSKLDKEKLKDLKTLSLNGANLKNIPQFLWDLGLKLESLDLSDNLFLIYPPELESLRDSLQNFKTDDDVPPFVLRLKWRADANRLRANKNIGTSG